MSDDVGPPPAPPVLIDTTIGLAGNVNIPDFAESSYIDMLGHIQGEADWQAIRGAAAGAPNSKLVTTILSELTYQVNCRVKGGSTAPRPVAEGSPEALQVLENTVVEIVHQVPSDKLHVALMKNLAGVQIDTDSASQLMEVVSKIVEQVNGDLK